jgi:hypothetical protein
MYMTPEHQRLVSDVMRAIQTINPYSSQEGRIGYIWASGYLASYLASLAEEDPYILKRFLKHTEQVKARRRPKQNKK